MTYHRRRTLPRVAGALLCFCLFLLAGRRAWSQVLVNEVLASNQLTNVDEDGDSSDWLELYNAGSAPVDLEGHTLSDQPSGAAAWTFPSRRLEPGGFLLVWCSGKDRAGDASQALLQTNSPLPITPAYLSLDDSWAILTGSPDAGSPPAGWSSVEFDDAAWQRGKPGFGFGDGDDVTEVPMGLGAVFLRGAFQVDLGAVPERLILELQYDDGVVAYLNGVRFLDINFAADEEPTFASVATRTVEARSRYRFDLEEEKPLLRQGKNVLAFVLLNRTYAGDDLSLIPQLGTVLSPLHTSFSLDSAGETITLRSPAGAVVDEVRFPPQIDDQSFGRSPDGGAELLYHLETTPGAPNHGATGSEPLVVADTKFSVDRGFYDAPFEVEITTATPGAAIRYTLDGTPPTQGAGMAYAGPIAIDRTTTLRAAAFHEGLKATNVDTHTYVFLSDVVVQDVQATLARGFPPRWGSTAADYGMDPEVIGPGGADRYGGKYAASIRDDLKSLPSVSIVLPTDDLFGAQGIYTNSEQRGAIWERPASVEWIDPAGELEFQVNAGLRVQGGAFRSHGLTKKHSFRLAFRGRYGASRLKEPLFEYAGSVGSFDSLVLRANSNDGWQWDAAGAKPLYVRDSFGRETVLAMGGVSSHERFVHVYLNGVYWGLYDLVERPDESFSANYFGGRKEEWDAISNDAPSSGSLTAWNTLLTKARQGLSSDTAYEALQGHRSDGSVDPALESYLDVPNMIDYMIVNLYVGNTDWPHKNWWTGRRTVDSTGFKFYMWDSEWSLGLQSDLGTNQTGVNIGVATPYGAARSNAEFRMLFADHLQRHFFEGGALYVDPFNRTWDPEHPERNVPAARFLKLAAQVEKALVAESARWGDQHVSRPYTRDEHWAPERDSLLRSYLPNRSQTVLQQFRTAKLYPSIEAPVFSQHGGTVPGGFRLLVTARQGQVLYTLDGADPRLRGGQTSPLALALDPPQTRTLVATGATARILAPKDDSLGLDWTRLGFDDASWLSGPTGVGFETGAGFEQEIATDLGELLFQVQASVYLRIAFDVSDPGAIDYLTLRMKYDDGYVAYINGEPVARANAPDEPSWDSTAIRSHTDSLALVFEVVDLSARKGLLREGRNVLAIEALNLRATDGDMLLVPELEEGRVVDGGIRIDRTTRVRARALDGDEWSALNEAVFVVEDSIPLRITELMYHPASGPEGSARDADEFEFIEVQNVGKEPLSLEGVRLEGGVEADLDSGNGELLGPGELAVLVESREAFSERYVTAGIRILGQYKGKLSNGGEALSLRGPLGESLLELEYSDQWVPATDGDGYSLVPLAPWAPASRWKDPSFWTSSATLGGTPGDPEPSWQGGLQLPGDVRQDGSQDVADAIVLLRLLFQGVTPPLPCDGATVFNGGNLAVFDIDGNGLLNVSDAIHLLNFIFRRGAPPALGADCVPIPGCGDSCL